MTDTAAEKYILALDQGTTSSRALLIDGSGRIKARAQKEFPQIYPQPGWIEHDPLEIWSSQYQVALEVLKKSEIDPKSIAGIGIANQRETTVVWDRRSGEPVYNAIVWQDRRTSDFCVELKKSRHRAQIEDATGLVPDAYFSATKLKWILDHVPEARQRAENGDLAFGTVDAWLIWKLTGGKVHATDATNASRTMLYNIHDLQWDPSMLELFDVPANMLPEVKDNSALYGRAHPDLFAASLPICGVAGDQQAALFGQMCIKEGMVKNTYGTGCFIIMNTGRKAIKSQNNLLSTLAWVLDRQPTYALEGSIFIAGAVVQWLRDGLKIIRSSEEVEQLAAEVQDNGGVYLVPAFAGLGAPHWDQYARGTLIGITRGTTGGHIARAALEAMAYQTRDVLDAMIADSKIKVNELRVDGGASVNRTLMQFQSDILGVKVIRPKNLETTAMGACYFAGLAAGVWQDMDEINALWQKETGFTPGLDEEECQLLLSGWRRAVGRSKEWLEKTP